MRIFLDANVLFSAAKSDGAVRELLALLDEAGHECWVDGYVIEEARRNLVAKAPAGIAVLDRLLPRMTTARTQPSDAALEASLPLPAKDRPVLAAAIRQGCATLVTGDRKHFGALYGRTIHGVTIHSPRSLSEALLV
ncbi:MAG: PIN domain-containing protein [Betaproteobacteria bacterium]|nr:PIN domain-containing protein [Betaproteobacteria bacterium]